MNNKTRKTNTQRINDLKNDGIKVFIKHRRVISRASFKKDRPEIVNEVHPLKDIRIHNWNLQDKSEFWFIEAKGGETYITVEDKDQRVMAETSLKCSHKDNYNKNKALAICLGRIEKQLH